MDLVVGIHAQMGAGKDHAGAYLSQLVRSHSKGADYTTQNASFAQSLKEFISKMYGIPMKVVDKSYSIPKKDFSSSQKNKVIPALKMTLGQALQIFGTDVCRNCFDKYIWINGSKNRIFDLWHNGPNTASFVTDIRFLNEVDALTEMDGVLDGRTKTLKIISFDNRAEKDSRDSSHESEQNIDDSEFDSVIDNSGTLMEFEEKLTEFFEKELLPLL